MHRFAFVPALVLPTSSSRSGYLCGSKVRSLRPSVPSRAYAPFQWRACITPTEQAKDVEEVAPEPVAKEPSEENSPAVEEPVAEAVAEEPVAEVTSEDPVAEVTSEDSVAEAKAEESVAEVENKQPAAKKPKRKRRRQREVTLPLEKLEVGMELEGVVKTITNYGAFVGDMGTPTDGLLHVSELAAGFVQNVTDVVQVGTKVKVRVTEINLERGNFSLSMKPLNADGSVESGKPEKRITRAEKWSQFTHDPNVFIDARVSTITDFGAFCQLLKEDLSNNDMAPTDGLVHISEVTEGRVDSISDYLEVGQIIKVRVVGVDRKRSRISLSMKEVSSESSSEGGGRDSRGRGGRSDSSKDLKAEIKASNDAQPTFKTSFELAFERAGFEQKSS